MGSICFESVAEVYLVPSSDERGCFSVPKTSPHIFLHIGVPRSVPKKMNSKKPFTHDPIMPGLT